MTRVARRRYLVTYDISDDQRREKIFEELTSFGDWAQYSVFFCDLTDQELVQMRSGIRAHVNHAVDQVMIVDLGPATRSLEHSLEVVGRAYEPVGRCFIF